MFRGNGNPEKFFYISWNQSFLYFRKDIFRTLTYLGLWYIQNPSIFRTRSIFRTLVYSERYQNIYVKTYCKNSYLAHFFIFRGTELSYISRNKTFLPNISLMFQEKTFRARKVKETTLKKFLIFQERTYKAPKTNKKSAVKKFFFSCDIFAILQQ